MSEPPLSRAEGFTSAVGFEEKSPEVLALNFYENTPVNKLIFQITPSPWDIRLTKISYSFGSMDLSANGYIQLVLSKTLNPNIYGMIEQNSNIIFSKMGGANKVVEGDSQFFENIVLGKNEAAYLYLISNVPAGLGLAVMGRLAMYYLPLYK